MSKTHNTQSQDKQKSGLQSAAQWLVCACAVCALVGKKFPLCVLTSKNDTRRKEFSSHLAFSPKTECFTPLFFYICDRFHMLGKFQMPVSDLLFFFLALCENMARLRPLMSCLLSRVLMETSCDLSSLVETA